MEFVMHRTERKADKSPTKPKDSPTKPKESPTKPEMKTPSRKTPEKGDNKTGSAEKKISPAKTDSNVIFVLIMGKKNKTILQSNSYILLLHQLHFYKLT
jgi:hypothetical protein